MHRNICIPESFLKHNGLAALCIVRFGQIDRVRLRNDLRNVCNRFRSDHYLPPCRFQRRVAMALDDVPNVHAIHHNAHAVYIDARLLHDPPGRALRHLAHVCTLYACLVCQCVPYKLNSILKCRNDLILRAAGKIHPFLLGQRKKAVFIFQTRHGPAIRRLLLLIRCPPGIHQPGQLGIFSGHGAAHGINGPLRQLPAITAEQSVFLKILIVCVLRRLCLPLLDAPVELSRAAHKAHGSTQQEVIAHLSCVIRREHRPAAVVQLQEPVCQRIQQIGGHFFHALTGPVNDPRQ